MDPSGPSNHMRFSEGENISGSIKTHKVFGSIKTHDVSRGEGSIKKLRVFGSTKTHVMRFQKGKHENGSIKRW